MTITVNGARKRVQQRVAGTPNAQGERLFVVIFNYVVGMRECEVMRLFLQRGRPCSELLGVSIGVAVRAKVKIEWPRLRPMQTTTGSLRNHQSHNNKLPPLPGPPPEHTGPRSPARNRRRSELTTASHPPTQASHKGPRSPAKRTAAGPQQDRPAAPRSSARSEAARRRGDAP